MSLQKIIQQHILRDGPMSFKDFMEMALYYPGHGYYYNSENCIGTDGDYYTSPHLTPIFGALIGRQIEEMWHNTGRKEFTIVEYGAGTGKLCYDILAYLKTNPALYNRLRYCIIEKSPAMQKTARSIVSEKVIWLDSISDLNAFDGCIIANELLDNFAVHRVVARNGLKEVFVGHDSKGFTEILLPATSEIAEYIHQIKGRLHEGCSAEVNCRRGNG